MEELNAVNEWLARRITGAVGTMYCAYLFAIIGIMAIVGAFTGNVGLVLIVGSISGYFLQLVLLPIIIVGQNLQGKKHEKRHNEMIQLHKNTLDHVRKIHKHLATSSEVATRVKAR